jgi:hypothetical protein
MKRRLSFLVCIVLLLVAIPGVAHADIGPKPSVDIKFSGLEGETYYVCILAQDRESVTPFEAPSLTRALADGWESYVPEEVLHKFLEYQDKDGFVPIYDIEDCSQTHYISPSRFMHRTFKVLIFFPETNNFVVSDRIYTKYAFNSYYRIDAKLCGLSPDASGELNLGMLYGFGFYKQIGAFLFRLTITLAIELAIAWNFRLREKRVIQLILLVNFITQTLLTLTLSVVDIMSSAFGAIAVYIVLETLVFLIEGFIYALRINKISETRFPTGTLWLYAWVANTVSFFAGAFLLIIGMIGTLIWGSALINF